MRSSSGHVLRILILILLLVPREATSQESRFAGHWEGEIRIPASPLGVRVDLTFDGEAWSGTIDIPIQSATGLPLAGISARGDSIWFAIANVPGDPSFEGVLADGRIEGSFRQAAFTFPFGLGREATVALDRPQTPQPPFPYRVMEVTYRNGEVTLAATITLPEGTGPYPGVVLVTGSGAQDRDETIFEHRPFAVIADHLTRAGIAVLRADDRGVGASTGSVSRSTSDDFAGDALAGVRMLASRPEVDATRIGLIGHSEGGMVGPMAAARSDSVAFLILLAGTGVPLGPVLVAQTRLLSEAAGMSGRLLDLQEEVQRELVRLLETDADSVAIRGALKRLVEVQLETVPAASRPTGEALEDVVTGHLDGVLTPWYRFAIKFDPRTALRRVKVPVLALNGTLDLQVPPDQNLPEIRRALEEAGNTDVTIRELPDLNHLFQHATTGAVSEYVRIEETISPEVLDFIRDWILQRFGGR